MSDTEGAEYAPEDLLLSSRNQRSAACSHFIAVEDVNSLSEETIEALVLSITHTVSLFNDRATRLQMDQLVFRLAAHEQFSDQMITALKDSASSSLHSWAALILLGWCRQLLAGRPSLVGEADRWNALCECIALVADYLFMTGASTRHRSIQLVRAMLRQSPDAAAPMLQFAVGSGGLGACPLICCLTEQMSAAELETNKVQLFELHSKLLLSAASRPAAHYYSCFDKLIATATDTDLSDQVMPALLRGIKRAPEAVLPVCGQLFGACVQDLSPYLVPVLETSLCEELRHSEASRREASIDTLAKLVAQCRQMDQIDAAANMIAGVLQGSAGKLAYNYQKEGCSAALQVLRDAPVEDTAGSSTCNMLLAVISELLSNEKDENVRISLILCMARWHAAGELPVEAATFWAGLLDGGKNDAVKAAALGSLHQLMSTSERTSLLATAEVRSTLCKLVSGCSKKPLERPTALAALCCLAQSTPTPVPDPVSKVWQNVFQEDSFLVSAGSMAKASAQDCQLQVFLVQKLLSDAEAYGLSLSAREALCTAISRCTISSHHSVYQAALSACAALCAASPATNVMMQDALSRVLDKETSESVTADAAARAVCAMVVTEPQLAITSGVVMLAHHPRTLSVDELYAPYAVDSYPSLSVGWKTLCRKVKGDQMQHTIDSLQLAEWTQLIADIASALQEDSITRRAAAVSACSTLVSVAGNEQAAAVLSAAVALLSDTALAALSAEDLALYRAPYVEHSDSTVGAVSFGGAKMSAEDKMYAGDEWEAELQKDLQRKAAGAKAAVKKPAEKKKPAAEKKKKVKKGEEEMNFDKKKKPAAKKKDDGKKGDKATSKDKASNSSKAGAAAAAGESDESGVGCIDAAVGRIITAMEAITAMSQTNPELVSEAMPNSVMPAISGLLQIYAVSDKVYKAFGQLLRWTCSSDAAPLYNLIALGCWRSSSDVPYERTLGEAAKKSDLFQNAVTALAAQGGQLGVAAFGAAFPMLQHILSGRASPLQSDALKVVCANAQYTVLPWLGMTRALVHTMKSTADINMCNNAGETLVAVCAKLPASLQLFHAVLEGLVCKTSTVRHAVLRAIQQVPSAMPDDARIAALLWMARHDTVKENQELGIQLWDQYGVSLGADYCEQLVPLLSHFDPEVRQLVGRAVAVAIESMPNTEQATLNELVELFVAMVDDSQEEDEFAMGVMPGSISAREIEDKQRQRVCARHGVACALEAAAAMWSGNSVNSILAFMMKRALGDSEHDVREQLTAAGIAIVTAHGEAQIATLLPLFEQELSATATSEREDNIHSAVVLFLGSLSKHLPKDDPKIPQIIERLIAALATPSEPVQKAAAQAITPLCKAIKGDPRAADFVEILKEQVVNAERMPERRGAAHGLACMVKGLGIISLKQHAIMEHLKTAVEDSKHANGRQGALFAYELLCQTLGRLFEPYVMQILPNLLRAYSDVPMVREADDNAARVVMGNLSAHGVKLVLPVLLEGLEDRQWRTKTAATNFLGSMAHCAPKQLSTCLPQIVPRLGDTLGDAHPEVRKCGKIALERIGSVIRNPEIQSVAPKLLKALEDPSNTREAIAALMATSYVHSIDAPSLALLAPILLRGMRDRSSEVKRNAVQIIGSMCTLVADKKDLVPYVGELLPEVKEVLLDPIPESRMFAAKALGMLVAGLGEEQFDELVPWLMLKIESAKSTIERFGAAQGLGEVLGALGAERLQGTMPDLLLRVTERNACVREGYIGVLLFLAPVFQEELGQYMDDMMPLIIQGLADDSEPVRDVSMQCAARLIETFCSQSEEMLLPVFYESLFDRNWRIRMSTVELMGILLAQLAGNPMANLRGDGILPEDDVSLTNALSEAGSAAMIEALGYDTYVQVVSQLYMMRSDENTQVANMSHRVWRSIVENTGRMLIEILDILIDKVMTFLSDSDVSKQELAGRALGELVRKMADRVLPELMPLLLERLQQPTSESHERHGVCLGLCEVIEHAAQGYIEGYLDQFIESISVALADDEAHVRHAAAEAFNMLNKAAGSRVVEQIVPSLLTQMHEDEGSNALDGLKEILSTKAGGVLSFVVPNLIESPIEPSQAAAIASLCEVAGGALDHYIDDITTALTENLYVLDADGDCQLRDYVLKACHALMAAMDEDNLQLMMMELYSSMDDEDMKVRVAAAKLAGEWAKCAEIDWSAHRVSLLQHLMPLLGDSEVQVNQAAVTAVTAVTASVPKGGLSNLIPLLRMELRTLSQASHQSGAGGEVAGFSVKKGIGAVLPVYLHGLMHGTPDTVRESAALALGELISATPEAGLKPFVLPITGPLIRIVGDRFPWQVKAAILATLTTLILKSGKALKPFLPQLQTSFVKLLHDDHSTLRSRSAVALQKLIALGPPRVAHLVGELHNAVKTSSVEVQKTLLKVLPAVVLGGGASLKADAVDELQQTMHELIAEGSDEVEQLCAAVLAACSINQSVAQLQQITSGVRQMSAVAQAAFVGYLLSHAGESAQAMEQEMCDWLCSLAQEGSEAQQCSLESFCQVIDKLEEEGLQQQLLHVLLAVLSSAGTEPDTIETALQQVKQCAKKGNLVDKVPTFVAATLPLVKSKSFIVKEAAQRTMIYLLQVNNGAEASTQVISSCRDASSLRDLVKKTLNRLAEDGESDEDK